MPESEHLTRTLSGQPASVRAARALTREFLGDDPRAGDAETIVSELATNAVRHSRSREEGGVFELRLEHKPDALRIEVVDQGPLVRAAALDPLEAFEPGENPHFPFGESGRGHLIVFSLADGSGHEQRPDRSLWWAELSRSTEHADV
jgi:anti-sigma regulatory factor (Ser/Thr protein kinase)